MVVVVVVVAAAAAAAAAVVVVVVVLLASSRGAGRADMRPGLCGSSVAPPSPAKPRHYSPAVRHTWPAIA